MKYNNIQKDAIVTKACVKAHFTNSNTWIVLHNYGSLTRGALVESLCNDDMTFALNDYREVLLSFEWEDREVTVTICNSTSDILSEHFLIDVNSSLFKDSISIGYDISFDAVDRYLSNPRDCKSVEEYYGKYYSKSVLREALIEYLIKDDFRYSLYGHDYVLGDKEIRIQADKTLSCLPADCLRTVIENYQYIRESCDSVKYVSVFLANAAKSGYLKFKPFIHQDSNGNYSLVLKYNRYVHLFRNMYYQCSYTEDGNGAYSSSGVRLDAMYQLFQKYELQESKLLKYLYYMNLIHCCREIDAFNQLLETNSELVDKFMRLSTEHLFDSYDVKYVDNIVNDMVTFMGYGVYRGKGPGFLEDPKEIYRVSKSETSDFARVNIYDSHMVGVEFWEQETVNEVLFTLPDIYYEDKDVASVADDWNMDEIKFTKMVTDAIYDSYEVRCALVAFALNFCGFITNFLVTYPMQQRKDSKLRALNKPDIPEFKNLGVLYKTKH